MTDAVATAQLVAEAVARIDGVVRLHGGTFGEVATYRAGGRIAGVRIGETEGEVHVVAGLHRNVRTVAEEARAAAERIAGVPVTVTVADVATDEEAAQEGT
ncbi:hypothetical protein [Antrihabitans cavernicola]|uniref:Asp23/Gls24 family envelope stress response protein n=1 Tax=Antrihabitans cavernicola TaxID=2495913 RepID=A0A5A7S8T9_9NOCA|nr:hypothetical protein [Spelaeibacter cavernicola]KAA0018949.1 hypothetical protein FOY51_23210 [Spelaeibacter cavernicola]